MNKRLRLYEYIINDIFKIPCGKRLPWYFIILHYILFPAKSLIILLDKAYPYDINTNIWTINGIKFHNEFFVHICTGRTTTVLKNEHGIITMREHGNLRNKVDENTELSVNNINPYDAQTNMWTIRGINYTDEFFKAVGQNIGTTITILENQEGYVMVHEHPNLRDRVTKDTELEIKK